MRPALSMKWTTSSRRLASWAKIASALVLSSAIVVVLVAEDVEHLLELLERRGAGANRGVQVLGVAVERGAELVDQELEAVLERLAQGVLREVGLDRGLVAGRGDRPVQRLGRGAGLAVQEVLGDQRLRLRGAARIGLELGEARSRPRSVTIAVFCGVMSRPVIVPAFTPATRSSEPLTRPKALKSSAW